MDTFIPALDPRPLADRTRPAGLQHNVAAHFAPTADVASLALLSFSLLLSHCRRSLLRLLLLHGCPAYQRHDSWANSFGGMGSDFCSGEDWGSSEPVDANEGDRCAIPLALTCDLIRFLNRQAQTAPLT
jgi:hypothetical protein